MRGARGPTNFRSYNLLVNDDVVICRAVYSKQLEPYTGTVWDRDRNGFILRVKRMFMGVVESGRK